MTADPRLLSDAVVNAARTDARTIGGEVGKALTVLLDDHDAQKQVIQKLRWTLAKIRDDRRLSKDGMRVQAHQALVETSPEVPSVPSTDGSD